MAEPEPEVVLLEELPRFERLKLRIMLGTLAMFEGQLRELGLPMQSRLGLPTEHAVRLWHDGVAALYASTVDTPEPKPVPDATHEEAL